jgi:hypothetical protein
MESNCCTASSTALVCFVFKAANFRAAIVEFRVDDMLLQDNSYSFALYSVFGMVMVTVRGMEWEFEALGNLVLA